VNTRILFACLVVAIAPLAVAHPSKSEPAKEKPAAKKEKPRKAKAQDDNRVRRSFFSPNGKLMLPQPAEVRR
jgi:hypothetical protein